MSTEMDSTAMPTFYRRLYPYKSIFNWLNQEPTPTKRFTHREFAFTLPGDVYLRYQSFADAEQFKKQLCSMTPTRFEIGPVYSARPRDRKTLRPGAFTPVQRELVFDIDMTDYDSIRTCCSGADICKRCWGFIAVAVKVLDHAIRDQFGYQHLLWVYSGRRGIHLWISDQEALDLTDDQRRSLVNWFTVVGGAKESSRRLNARFGGALPPLLQSCLSELSATFETLILHDQNPFEKEENWRSLLEYFPPKIRSTLESDWSMFSDRHSVDKWKDVRDEFRKAVKNDPSPTVKAPMEDVVITYTYPRLDAEVSKHRNHLLKAPFCIHPGTGRVCVPVDPDRVDEFDPAAVPTLGKLLKELDALHTAGSSDPPTEQHTDWEKTSLKPYVDMLDKHCAAIMNENRKIRRSTADLSW
ncbi:hypothetical protein ONZ45_g2848 [Pleurotus djamor]|nr:hypothetical protein ONZ45_g2848 [Pleurotus djamor]